MWANFKNFLTQNVHGVDIFFAGLWLFGWWHNADCPAKYDLQSLTMFYGVVRGYILGGHAINSIWNSSPGQPPEGEK